MDEIWLAWVPRESLDTGTTQICRGCAPGTSRMSTSHYRMVIMFLTYLMDILLLAAVKVEDSYPDMSHVVTMATNIL
jgi:hypothetical protein